MKNWKKIGPVVYHTNDGKIEKYDSLDEFVLDKRWDTINNICEKDYYNHWRLGRVFDDETRRDYLEDEMGFKIPKWKILERANSIKDIWYQGYYWHGPKRKWRGHRAPHTFQEIKTTKWHMDDYRDYPVKIRNRRGAGLLPDAWDDISHSDWDARSWKKYRKTQYKT